MFDLTLFPLAINNGREQYDLPGLMALAAPRKTGRMRAQDLLVMFAHLARFSGGPAPFTHAQQKEILSRLAETYFSSSGSVTAGMRVTAARLNDFLLNRNLKAGQEGQMVGSLTLVVARGETLYVAHGGPAHTLVLSQNDVQHYDDGQGIRSLGLSRQAVLRFYQTTLAAGDMLVLSPDPPAVWSKSLAGSPQSSLEHMRRRLVSNAGPDLQAACVRFNAGKGGLVSYWRPAEPAAPKAEPAAPKAEPAAPFLEPEASRAPLVEADLEQAAAPGEMLFSPPPAPAGEVPAEIPAVRAVFPGEPAAPKAEPAVRKDEPAAPKAEPAVRKAEPAVRKSELVDLNADMPVQAAEPLKVETHSRAAAGRAAPARPGFVRAPDGGAQRAPGQKPAQQPMGQPPAKPAADPLSALRRLTGQRSAPPQPAAKPAAKPAQPQPPPAGPSFLERARVRLAAAWQGSSAARRRIGGNVAGTAARVLPKRSEPLINLSPSLMLFIAILVPMMVVAVGTTVYVRSGRTEQFEILFTQAQQYAQQAAEESDPLLLKQSWTTVLKLVSDAEKYGRSDESVVLRAKAQTELDELQGIVRLDFQSTTTSSSLGSGVNITRMIAALNQVFMLDASEGRILSMTRITTGGYEPNLYFSCSPAKAGGAIVGPLIDLAELPINNELRAEIMGIDAGGNLVYCTSGQTGFDSQPLALPDLGWGKITAITTYGQTLYVLDPPSNAVYRYDGEKGIFSGKPHLYFDNDIPHMADVVDLAVDQESLYLLHADGRMTICSSGGVSFGNTRCTDPAPYGDQRTGFEPSTLIFPGAQLTQVQTTQPPDPSLFALDTLNQSVYHLSQRRLNFQREYRNLSAGDYPFPKGPPTAFAVTPNRRLLIAFGDRVFFAPLP